jgi:acetaldehyde dehydrogenase (acetylating)
VIHAREPDVITAFGIEKPAFRIVVNTWGTLGAIGATTGVMPSMTLAPGGLGGAVVGDNITVHHVLNIKRLARVIRKPPAEASSLAPGIVAPPARTGEPAAAPGSQGEGPDREAIAEIVRRVLAEFGR